MPTLFGEKLAYLQQSQQMTQVALARALQLASSAYVNNMQAGRKAPSLEIILKVANLFGVTTDYLLLDTLPITPPLPSSFDPSQTTPHLLGTKIKYLRKQHSMTQQHLAHQLGLRTQAHISHIEAQRHEPSLEVIVKLAHVFGVTTDYLLRDSIPMNAAVFSPRKEDDTVDDDL
ncbi:MAG TPA: helix-turn-helix transcriptional regulator [Herpetosiphonaceae bacterium]